MAQTCVRGCTFLGSSGKLGITCAGDSGKLDRLHQLSPDKHKTGETSCKGSWDAHYGICQARTWPDKVASVPGFSYSFMEKYPVSFKNASRPSHWKASAYSGQHQAKVAADRSSPEASTAVAPEQRQPFPGRLTNAEASPQGSTKASSSKALIADEAASHFQQFDRVVQELGGFDNAVHAEVDHATVARSYENGSWPVLLGLVDGAAGTAPSNFEVQLKELRAERATKNASWAAEKAEMEAKLEEMSREVANLEALLHELQQEALRATETAGPWQGEQAELEERAWWPMMRTPVVSTSSSASTAPRHSTFQGPRPTLAPSAPQATPFALPPASPHSFFSSSPAFEAQSREAEHPPLLAAKQGLTQRLSELRTQVADARGAPSHAPTLLTSLSLRFLECLRECQRGGSEVLGNLSVNIQNVQGQALPMLQRGVREGRWIVAAIVLTAAAALAGGVVQRAYRHHREVQIVAAQVAAEERMQQMQGAVIDLTVDNFVPVLTTRPTIVKFYTDWCPYCKRLAPTWEELAQRVSEKGLNVQVARLNADVYSEPAMDLNLKGFPSLVLFQGTKPVLNYTGPRDLDALLGVVEASYSPEHVA